MASLETRWIRAVRSLREPALRISYVRSEILARPLADVADALDAIAARAEQADVYARDVLAATVPLFATDDLAAKVELLRLEARGRSLLALGRLLRKKHRAILEDDTDPAARTFAMTAGGKPLTLGERKALARRPSRATLDKLLRDPHPLVVRNVLDNPRVTEDDVVRMAARRPAYADVLAEIARHPKWSQRGRVRMALIQNPYAPAELVVPMVRLLIRPELEQVLEAADVQAVVRAAASELLERRPPVPDKGGPTRPQ